MDEENELIAAHKGRKLQKRTMRRKIFGKARQEIFLAELAASCNVRSAAGAAGICTTTAYLKRRTCPLFRAAWQEALEEGYARLEAAMLEAALKALRPKTKTGATPPITGMDATTAMHLLREHKKGLAGITERRGRAPGSAPIEEACDRLEKKLKVLKARLDSEAAQRAEAPSAGDRPR
jgi:hypothetical protein